MRSTMVRAVVWLLALAFATLSGLGAPLAGRKTPGSKELDNRLSAIESTFSAIKSESKWGQPHAHIARLLDVRAMAVIPGVQVRAGFAVQGDGKGNLRKTCVVNPRALVGLGLGVNVSNPMTGGSTAEYYCTAQAPQNPKKSAIPLLEAGVGSCTTLAVFGGMQNVGISLGDGVRNVAGKLLSRIRKRARPELEMRTVNSFVEGMYEPGGCFGLMVGPFPTPVPAAVHAGLGINIKVPVPKSKTTVDKLQSQIDAARVALAAGDRAAAFDGIRTLERFLFGAGGINKR